MLRWATQGQYKVLAHHCGAAATWTSYQSFSTASVLYRASSKKSTVGSRRGTKYQAVNTTSTSAGSDAASPHERNSEGDGKPKRESSAPIGTLDDGGVQTLPRGGSTARSISSSRSAVKRGTITEKKADKRKAAEAPAVRAAAPRPPHRPVTIFPTVYYTEDSVCPGNKTIEENTATLEANAKAERQSIAKLLIISQSVGAIFCALPGRHSVEEYLTKVDGAVATDTVPRMQQNSLLGAAASDARLGTLSGDFIAERVLVEQNADHQFCIHVRDMEQLVPPSHLISPISGAGETKSPTGAATIISSKNNGGESRQKRIDGKQPPTLSTKAEEEQPAKLDPVERLKAMHKWRFDALKQSKWSLARNAVPNNVHAITRLRLHEPAKVDVTVVQSCGAPKRPEDILAALNRFTKGQKPDPASKGDAGEQGSGIKKEEEEVMKAIFLAAFTQQSGEERHDAIQSIAAMGMLPPFVVKPLITVYASCLPRREAVIGKPVADDEFWGESQTRLAKEWLASLNHMIEKLEGKGAEPPQRGTRNKKEHRLTLAKMERDILRLAAPNVGFSQEEQSFYRGYYARPVPHMPRHTTRLTLMAEHNDFDGSELVSLAELVTTRRQSKQEATKGKDSEEKVKPPNGPGLAPRIYCLIKDGIAL